jgi:hypothetical protein
MTPKRAAEMMLHAHEYLYESRRPVHLFEGTRKDYDAHNMAHSILFFARKEAENFVAEE